MVAKCSHGSVSAERAAMKREEEELKPRIAENKPMQRSGFKSLASSFPQSKKLARFDKSLVRAIQILVVALFLRSCFKVRGSPKGLLCRH